MKRRFGSEMLPGFFDELWVRRIIPSARPLRAELEPTEDLISSIREKGVIQPIVVRPVENRFEVIAGNRRLAACRRLGLKKIPAYLVGLDDRQAYEVSLIENLQRRSLNPIEEARAFRNYVDEFGYGGVSDLAKKIGKSQPFVSKRLALLDLPMAVQDQLIRERIAPSFAEEFIHLGEDDVRFASSLVQEGATRDQIRSVIRKRRSDGAASQDSRHAQHDPGSSMRRVEKVTSKCETALRLCLLRVDDAITGLDDGEWIVSEELAAVRKALHGSIDDVIRLRKRAVAHPEVVVGQSAHQKVLTT